jgi:hypothetical protein
MMSAFRSVLLAVFLLCNLSACVGEAPEPPPPWKLVALEGVVQINDEGQVFRPAALSELLNEGSVLATGSESTAQLSNGLQMITVSANSRLKIPENRGDGVTRVLQEIGRILFQVDRRSSPHFEVLTPLATAVVKGTTFEVRVSSERTTVQVTDGLVEVRSTEGDTRRDVPMYHEAHIVRVEPRSVVVYRVAQSGASGAASAPGNALNPGTGSGPDGSSPASVPTAIGSRGLSDQPNVTGSQAVALDGDSRTRDESSASTRSERAGETVEAGPSAGGSAAPAPSQTSADAIGPAPAPTRPAAQANGDENDDAATILRYAMWLGIAWIIFVPFMLAGQAILRRRKAASVKKRKDR